MSKVSVRAFSLSLDGFGAGPEQSLENPLGVNGMGLHEWAFKTRTFRTMHGQDGGETGVDDQFAARGFENVGAWILGRNMFGPVRGQWPDENWKGWWAQTRPITSRFLSSPITRGHRLRWKVARPSILLPTESNPRCGKRWMRPKAGMSGSVVEFRQFNSIYGAA
jgi:hypothetical protein